MNKPYSRIGRRSFLTNTVGGLAGLSALSAVSISTETARAQPSLDADSDSNSDDAWTQFGADAGHTAYLKDDVGPKGTLKKAWEKSGSGSSYGIVVVNGMVTSAWRGSLWC